MKTNEKMESEIMEIEANIDYEFDPFAIIEYGGERVNIYPFLSSQSQNKVKRNYNQTITLTVSQKAIREALPNVWKQILLAKRITKRLPAHITNAMLNVPTYDFPKPERALVIVPDIHLAMYEEDTIRPSILTYLKSRLKTPSIPVMAVGDLIDPMESD